MAAAANRNQWVEYYAKVNGTALSRYPGLLFEWFPTGVISGGEFEVGSIDGRPGKSLKVNIRSGRWADFAGVEKGGDPISLYAELHQMKQGEAGLALGRELGLDPPKPESVRSNKDAWEPVLPIPPEMLRGRDLVLPPNDHPGRYAAAWLYEDDAGGVMFRIRNEDPLSHKKTGVWPLCWCQNRETQQAGWRFKEPSKGPFPLFNLKALQANPNARVLIVEGEPSADAGMELLESSDWVVVTWAGGSGRVKDTNWTPLFGRQIWIWPDNDKNGRKAALDITTILAASKPSIVKIDPAWPEKFDIADAQKAGWTTAGAIEWLEIQFIPFEGGAKAIRGAVVEDRGVSQGDIFIADRFLAKHKEDVRYCPSRGWLIWDGRRWALDEREGIVKLAEHIVRDLYREAADVDDEKERAELVKFATICSRVERLRGALAIARPHVVVVQNDLDTDGFLLNCRNGTVDLRTNDIKPHDRADLITKLVDIDYDPTAEAPRFHRFLQEIFDGKTEIIEYLQKAIGHSFTSDQREQCLHFLHGAGSNGKSTLVEVLLEVAGEYGQVSPPETLLARVGDSIPTEIARMCGSRFVAMSETGESKAIDEATVKKLTSSEPIAARFLHRDYFQFKPSHHLWLSSNHKPHISGADLGIWRRIRLIPFTQTFPIDGAVKEALMGELSGVLDWVVRGAAAWFADGKLMPPSEILNATAQYRSEQDVLDEFLRECCEEDIHAEIKSKDLYEAYTAWAKESGERYPWSKKFLARRLGDRGFIPSHTRIGTIWKGLQIRHFSQTE